MQTECRKAAVIIMMMYVLQSLSLDLQNTLHKGYHHLNSFGNGTFVGKGKGCCEVSATLNFCWCGFGIFGILVWFLDAWIDCCNSCLPKRTCSSCDS